MCSVFTKSEVRTLIFAWNKNQNPKGYIFVSLAVNSSDTGVGQDLKKWLAEARKRCDDRFLNLKKFFPLYNLLIL